MILFMIRSKNIIRDAEINRIEDIIVKFCYHVVPHIFIKMFLSNVRCQEGCLENFDKFYEIEDFKVCLLNCKVIF